MPVPVVLQLLALAVALPALVVALVAQARGSEVLAVRAGITCGTAGAVCFLVGVLT